MSQLAPNLAKVLAHSETVRHSAKPVLEILEEAFKLRRIVGVGDDSCKIENLMQTIPWINWGFYVCLVFTTTGALWEPWSTFPATFLVRFESNFKGSRALSLV